LSPGCSLGNEDHGEGGLACREGIRREAGGFKTRATRSQELCRVPDYAECQISAGDSQAGGTKRFGIVRRATGLTYWGDETFR
jgi:hypothetical protein